MFFKMLSSHIGMNYNAMKSLVKIYANACICIYFKRAAFLIGIMKYIVYINLTTNIYCYNIICHVLLYYNAARI